MARICTLTPIIVICMGLMAQSAFSNSSITVTVNPGAEQTFHGFGASHSEDARLYAPLTTAQKMQLQKALYSSPINARILRLWWQPGSPDEPESFVRNYIRSGFIADAKSAGCDTLLLAPAAIPRQFVTIREGRRYLTDVTGYPQYIADFIQSIKIRYGVMMDATGLINEPNADASKMVDTAEWPSLVTNLRKDLDAYGLNKTIVVAPEDCCCADISVQELSLIKQNNAAWQSLGAFATHSYDMAANVGVQQLLEGTQKRYWITEAGPQIQLYPLSPAPYEYNGPAMALAGRFLNDMNHQVTDWIWFLDFCQENEFPNIGTAFLYCYAPNPAFKVSYWLQYYYMKQLAETFDTGALCRKSTGSLVDVAGGADMLWTYRTRPPVIAAAAKNTNGSWAIGIQNCTNTSLADDGSSYDCFSKDTTFDVTIEIPELANVPKTTFQIRHSNTNIHDEKAGTILFVRGKAVLNNVEPSGLWTLRSQSAR